MKFGSREHLRALDKMEREAEKRVAELKRDRPLRRVSRGGAFLDPEVADEIERMRKRDAERDEL